MFIISGHIVSYLLPAPSSLTPPSSSIPGKSIGEFSPTDQNYDQSQNGFRLTLNPTYPSLKRTKADQLAGEHRSEKSSIDLVVGEYHTYRTALGTLLAPPYTKGAKQILDIFDLSVAKNADLGGGSHHIMRS